MKTLLAGLVLFLCFMLLAWTESPCELPNGLIDQECQP
jgi:hypothetical protein